MKNNRKGSQNDLEEVGRTYDKIEGGDHHSNSCQSFGRSEKEIRKKGVYRCDSCKIEELTQEIAFGNGHAIVFHLSTSQQESLSWLLYTLTYDDPLCRAYDSTV